MCNVVALMVDHVTMMAANHRAGRSADNGAHGSSDDGPSAGARRCTSEWTGHRACREAGEG
jgi:hypothetical protein